MVLCLVALDRAGWRVQLGDLGTWVGGLGSALAAGAAFLTLRQLLSTRREQLAVERGRVQRRAARVELRTKPVTTSASSPGWSVVLTNQSGHPIYDVRWLGLVAMQPDPPDTRTEFICIPTWSEFPDYERVVLDSATSGVEYIANPPEMRESHYPFPRVEFTDDDGYEFKYVIDRLAFGGEILGKWELKGPAKPAKATPKRLGKVVPPLDIEPS